MDVLSAITSRRSVRTYTSEPIDQTLMKTIAQYWLYAPSAHNQQAWKFFLISKKEDHEFLWETMEFGKMIPNASGVILACFNKEQLKSPEFIQQDMWASIQNILLAAHEKWIWAVWVGIYPHEREIQKIHTYFKLEKQIIPFAIISLGYPEIPLKEKNIKTEWKITIL